MTRSWISDTPDEVEHPPVPLGINEMAVPRVAILLSLSTILVILLSTAWIGISAYSFMGQLEDSFGSVDESMLEVDGRWAWEVDLLFDTCDSREDDWDWPENLSSQDDVFLYPGELRCDWEHQGSGDRASVAVYNRGNQTLDLLLEIEGANVLFSSSDDTQMLINEFQGNDSIILEIELTEDVDESSFTVVASHVALVSAEVKLDVTVFKGVEERELHSKDGDRLQVNYKVWDADTGELLDEGDLLVTAGDDPNYIEGFGWSAIGLDINSVAPVGTPAGWGPGTSHITLLPPSIAYGGSESHELKNSWLRFELEVTAIVGV